MANLPGLTHGITNCKNCTQCSYVHTKTSSYVSFNGHIYQHMYNNTEWPKKKSIEFPNFVTL